MAHLVEVAFKGNRKEFFLWDYPDPPPLNAAVIVDVERGEDLGYVYSLGDLAQKRNGGCSHGCGTSLPERKALRLATEKDRGQSRDLERLNEEARRKAMERVRANGLGMKLSDAEWQWDRKKLTLYFTADKRVDFRNLVRDLASLFRTRIELKVIDEVIPEPKGGAHADHETAAKSLQAVLLRYLEELRKMRPEKLVRRRRQKFLRLGAWSE